MSTQPAEVPIDRLGRNSEISRDLSIGHSADRFHEDVVIQVRELLPVRGTKGLATERPSAMETRKPLDSFGGLVSLEEAGLLVAPVMSQSVVESALGIGAVWRSPLFSLCRTGKHIWPVASDRPDTFSEAQLTEQGLHVAPGGVVVGHGLLGTHPDLVEANLTERLPALPGVSRRPEFHYVGTTGQIGEAR